MITIVSLMALVALAAIAVPIANAASTDANRVVTVSKGDIQSARAGTTPGGTPRSALHNGVADVGNLITTSHGSMPVDVPGGWLTLNGQIVAHYPSDEYFSSSFTNPENWGPFSTPVSSYWEGGINTTVTPILNAQNTVTGFKVSAAPPRTATCTTPAHDLHEPRVRRGHVCVPRHFALARQRRWQRRLGREGRGKAITVTPYEAPAV